MEAFALLVRATDFKSDGGRGDTSPAGSIPVRFRQLAVLSSAMSEREGRPMVQTAPVVIHFRDLDESHNLRQLIEKRCAHLHDEFHEVSRFEITLEEDGVGFVAHGHVTGKGTDIGTHVVAKGLEGAADQLLDKIERHLRRVHDKRIFGQRRDARRDPPKRVIPN